MKRVRGSAASRKQKGGFDLIEKDAGHLPSGKASGICIFRQSVYLRLLRGFRPAVRRGPAQWPLCPTYALRPSPAYKVASSLVQWPFSGCPRYHRAYTFLSAFRWRPAFTVVFQDSHGAKNKNARLLSFYGLTEWKQDVYQAANHDALIT